MAMFSAIIRFVEFGMPLIVLILKTSFDPIISETHPHFNFSAFPSFMYSQPYKLNCKLLTTNIVTAFDEA